MATEPGATYGLRLVLWSNQSDYLVTWSPAAGFRVGIRRQDVIILFTCRPTANRETAASYNQANAKVVDQQRVNLYLLSSNVK